MVSPVSQNTSSLFLQLLSCIITYIAIFKFTTEIGANLHPMASPDHTDAFPYKALHSYTLNHT